MLGHIEEEKPEAEATRPSSPVLLCLDLWPLAARAIEPAATRSAAEVSNLLSTARRRRHTLVHLWCGQGDYRPARAFDPLPAEPVFRRDESTAAFASPGFRPFINRLNPIALRIVAGTASDTSLSLALALANAGFDVTLLAECLADAGPLDPHLIARQAFVAHPRLTIALRPHQGSPGRSVVANAGSS